MPAFSGIVGDYLRSLPDPNRFVSSLEDRGEQELGGLSRFAANEDALEGMSVQEDREEQAARAREQSLSASARSEGQLRRRQRALGLTLSDRQQRAQSRNLGLTRAISQSSAVTGANRTTADIARLSNRAGAGIQEQLQMISNQGLTQLANAEGQRNQREAAEDAQDDARRNNILGSAAAIGMAMISSEELKDKEGPAENMLDKLRKIRVDKWRYKGEDQSHVGAYAEEFNDTFGVNQDNRGMISLVDAIGVTMGALKELDKKVTAHG